MHIRGGFFGQEASFPLVLLAPDPAAAYRCSTKSVRALYGAFHAAAPSSHPREQQSWARTDAKLQLSKKKKSVCVFESCFFFWVKISEIRATITEKDDCFGAEDASAVMRVSPKSALLELRTQPPNFPASSSLKVTPGLPGQS